MTKQFKTAFASLAVATLCTLGAASQASAFDLLDAMLNGKYAKSCGCSQKSGDHVQRCSSNCGGKGVRENAQKRSSVGKGKSHVGPVQKNEVAKKGSGDHVQRAGRSKGGHVQRSTCAKGGKGSRKSSCHGAELMTMVRDKMTSMKCKLSSLCSGRSSGKEKVGSKSGGFGDDGRPVVLPAPRILDDTDSVPIPDDPDPTV